MNREAIESFVDEIRDELPKLRRAFAIMHACPEDRDAQLEAHRLTHSFKGTAALVGVRTLSQIADQQEQLLERLIDGRLPMSDLLRDTLERLADIIQDLANGLIAGTVPEQRLLSDAIALCQRHDPALGAGLPTSALGAGLPTPPAGPTAGLPDESPAASENSGETCRPENGGVGRPAPSASSAPSAAEESALSEVSEPMVVSGFMELSPWDAFRIEAVGHLRVLVERLETYRSDLTRWDVLADVRRRVSSLKRGASAVHLVDFVELAQRAEDLMQRVLDRVVPPTEHAANCLQACVDALEQQIELRLDESNLQQLHERIDELCDVNFSEPPPASERAEVEPIEDTADVVQPASQTPSVRQEVTEQRGPTLPESIPLDDRGQLSDEMLEVFTEEAEDHLRLIYSAFAELQKHPERMSAIQDVRRSAHTIKGAAGSVGLWLVSKLSHRMEDLLERLFTAQQPITANTLALLFDTTDVLQDLVHGDYAAEGMQVAVAQLYDSFDVLLGDAVLVQVPETTQPGREPIADGRQPLSFFPAEESTTAELAKISQEPLKPEAQAKSDLEETSLALQASMNTLDGGEQYSAPTSDSPVPEVVEAADTGDILLSDESSPSAVVEWSATVDAPSTETSSPTIEEPVVSDEVTVVDAAPGPLTLSEPAATTQNVPGERGGVSPSMAPIPNRGADAAPLAEAHAANELIVQDFLPMLAAWNRLEEPVAVPLPQPAAQTLAASDEQRRQGESLRVPLARIDSLMREVGELIINRSAFEQRMLDFARCVEELQRAVTRMKSTAHELDTKYGVGALGGRRALWGDGASLMPGGRRLPGASGEEFDALEFDRYTEFHLLSRSLAETTTDMGTVSNELRNLMGDFDQLLNRQGRLSRDTQDRLMRIRMVPLGSLATKLHRTVRVVAGQQHKHVEFLIQGGDTELDKVVLEELADPLMHILRNAVDHGIESVAERQAANKPEQATIRVQALYQGTQVVIRASDDGVGLNFDAIRETAVRHGLVTTAEVANLSDDKLASFIFLPGFSTSREVSEVSGRGVGMDIVRDKVQKLKGTVSVDSQAGQGTTFTIRLPMTLAVTRALMVHAAAETFAVPMQSVVQILRLERKEIELLGPSPVIRLGADALPLIYLAERLGLRTTADKRSPNLPVLVLAAGDQKIAVVVDKILAGRDIVVKTLGSHLRRVKGLIGATLMGDGSVVPILDAADLVGHAGTVSRHGISAPHRPVPRDQSPLIMIVDDSVSVRRVMTNLLRNAGWNVLDAKDGIDALEKLHQAERQPNLFLLDIEMPRMDGYELLTSLRSEAEHQQTPIIMVTSRAGEKHRQKATQLGATDYVIKPYQDDELLTLIRRLLPAGREAVLI